MAEVLGGETPVDLRFRIANNGIPKVEETQGGGTIGSDAVLGASMNGARTMECFAIAEHDNLSAISHVDLDVGFSWHQSSCDRNRLPLVELEVHYAELKKLIREGPFQGAGSPE